MSSVHDRYLTITDGTRIHYCVYEPTDKAAPVFLFIHGLGSNWTRWKRLVEDPFLKPFRRIIPDLRGHGDSITRRGIDADGFAADLELILKKEETHRPVVVGHCMGANIAVRLWERNPQNIRALILIEPFITEDLQRAWKLLHAVLGPVLGIVGLLAGLFNRLGLRRTRFRRIDYSVYDDWVRPRLTNLINVIRFMGPWLDLQCMPTVGYIASYRVLFRYRPPWRNIEAPTLALIARQGDVLSRESGGHPLDRPGIQTVGIEASHFVLTDNREGVVRQIQTFVDGLKRNEPWKN
ncbi:MAG: alpha/beta hydrolase [Nitrospirae bacterium]|nr:alpha/beta hydrolase [Nitrospirota bacterium]